MSAKGREEGEELTLTFRKNLIKKKKLAYVFTVFSAMIVSLLLRSV
jgi:hypothetical protein